jgi:hypothetical protein
VVVRVSPDEYDQLARHATDAALTVPSYLAALGLNPDTVPAALHRSILTHTTALRRILTTANATPDVASSTADQVATLLERLTALVERIESARPRGRRS